MYNIHVHVQYHNRINSDKDVYLDCLKEEKTVPRILIKQVAKEINCSI